MKQASETTEQYQDTEVLYLISLIKSAIRGIDAVPLPKVPDGLDWQRLYNIAKRHLVIALVYPCVQAIEGCPDELLAKWKQEADTMLRKDLQFDIAREEIYKGFDKNGIDYLPLKGIIIKDFYPRKGMREFSDNDILIRKKDIIAADKVMRSLSYQIDGTDVFADYSPHKELETVYSYSRNNLYHFEIHNELFYTWDYIWQTHRSEWDKNFKKWDNLVKFFEKTWERAIKSDGDNHAYYLKDEDFYFYFLAHFYKHYRVNGGAGFRSFVDLYYVKKNLNLNRDYLTQCYKEAGCPNLAAFEKEAEQITDCLFGDKPQEILAETLSYIASSGAYGSSKNIEKKNTKKRNRFVVALSKIFPSLTGMKLRYKVLNKAPILLPIFYVVRFFDIMFSSSKRGRLKRAIKKFFKRK